MKLWGLVIYSIFFKFVTHGREPYGALYKLKAEKIEQIIF